MLAASASLHAGAGRVYLCALDPGVARALVPTQPELMLRDIGTLAVEQMTVVCGCGGGDAVREHLPRLVSRARALVLDADALKVETRAARERMARELLLFESLYKYNK